ncbi:MAG: lipopolysaccharide biosynthesis protein [Rubrivivax sp.]|nr:lipopolysaccharide biosynthesis protein [Rubrivivax sp.]
MAVAAAAFGLASLWPATYTSRASFMLPQPPQSSLAGSLASLGPLASLGLGGATRSPAEQYVALMQSTLVQDRLLDRFALLAVYDVEFRVDAQRRLTERTRISVGRKDGLVSVEVDDRDAKRAADIANAHIEELRALLSRLAVTEAQQRRVFFESQLEQAQERLIRAQLALQDSGFTQGALRAEPRAAAEEYGRLKGEVTAAEVRVQTMQGYLSDAAPEMRQARDTLQALRAQLRTLERAAGPVGKGGTDYVTKYREFKYRETLFELLAKQYEIARVDESRENPLIQIIDSATPPEKQSAPRRVRITAAAAGAALLLLCAAALARRRGAPARQRRS